MINKSIYIHKEPPLAWLIFNRPEMRNAISLEMWREIPILIEEIKEDLSIRALIIRGAGEEAFIAGADISQFEKVRFGSSTINYDEAIKNALASILALEKPVISMIHGFCMGGGCAIALMSDLRLAADDAKFGIPAAKLGIAYTSRGVERLVQLVGPGNASEILLTGNKDFDADKAYHMGLINRIIAKSELEEFTYKWASDMAKNAPLSLSAHKVSINELLKPPVDRDLDKLSMLASRCSTSKDYKEGVAAFLEKRRPNFQGK